MRDIVIFLVVFGLLPIAIKRPWVGALMWAWLGIMSPHRLAYGMAYDFPFAQVVAAATLIGLVVTKDRRSFPIDGTILLLIVFIAWMCFTALFALHPDMIGEMFAKIMKIQLMLLVSLAVLHSRRHLELLLWVIVGSIGFYGFKGGLFTILTGGSERVWGPPGTFIAGNNELALALVMTIPLAHYLYTVDSNKWRKVLLGSVALLSAVAVLGSQSRGGFLAISAMSMVLWVRSSKKLLMLAMLLPLGLGLLAFMPDSWHNRMETVQTYEQDGSAMGRINAWQMAYNLAKDRWMGGSFEVAQPEEFMKYAPDPTNPLAAHSIYFQILGEHGFIGLGLFLMLWMVTWRSAARIRKEASRYKETTWMVNLVGMIQVSLVGFFVGGAFLSLAYFDVPYYLIGIVALCNVLLKEHVRGLKSSQRDSLSTAPAAWQGGSAQV